MKKIIYSIFSISLLLFMFTACEEEVEIWESSTGDLDGNWYVHYDHSVLGSDPYGYGLTPLYTYNTAANNGEEIWLTDDDNFWEYKVRVPANPENLTFGTEQVLTNQVDGYPIGVTITEGKIIKDATTLSSGVTVDSIYFKIWFEDLAAALEDYTEVDTFIVSGYRKTGFVEDEPH